VPINLPPYSSYGITPPMTPFSHEVDGPPARNYVQPLSPTPPRSAPAFEDYALSRSMSAMSINTYTPEPSRPNSGSGSPIEQLAPCSPPNTSNIYQPPRRPGQHMRTMTSGSIASLSSLSAASHSGSHGVPVPTQYQYGGQQRPLPPLHRPYSYSSSPRSIDLVTPYVSSTPVSPRAEPITTAYRKSIDGEDRGSDSRRDSGGSLKTLFNFDAIRGDPYVPEITAASPDNKYLTYSNGAPMLARMSPTSVRMR
jgi:hypothetical protein